MKYPDAIVKTRECDSETEIRFRNIYSEIVKPLKPDWGHIYFGIFKGIPVCFPAYDCPFETIDAKEFLRRFDELNAP